MRTIVIGEIGNNWKCISDLENSISFLRNHKCLIKLQAFDKGQFKHLDKFVLPRDAIIRFTSKDVFYSVFSNSYVDWLEDNIKPNYYKIASRYYKEISLLERVVSTKKTVFRSIPFVENYKNSPHTIDFHCVSEYPAKNAHLERINKDGLIGLSDHTTSTLVPSLAVARGAKFIEKHFSIRPMDSPDIGHSLLPHEWKLMLKNIEECENHCQKL